MERTDQKPIQRLALGKGLASLLPAHAAEDRTLGSDIAGLLEYAREHNPELAATRFDADAAATCFFTGD